MIRGDGVDQVPQEPADELPEHASEELADAVPDEGIVEALFDGVQDWIFDLAKQNSYVLFLLVYSFVRATGITVKSGTTGLLFSFGRARRVIAPGFRMLIPFLQVVPSIVGLCIVCRFSYRGTAYMIEFLGHTGHKQQFQGPPVRRPNPPPLITFRLFDADQSAWFCNQV